MAEALNNSSEHDNIEGLRDEALLFVDQALLLEENNHIREAIGMYQKALAKLDLALARYHQMGDDPKAKSRRLKLNRVRQQIQFRLQEHKVPGASARPHDMRVFQFSVDSELPSDAEILFTIPREVQIFYISVTGEVSCPSYPSALHIFRFKDCGPEREHQPAFLKVGSWVYPLVPGQSPVLKSHLGKYMFPDLDDTIEGNAIGLILPDDLPGDELQVFDVILDQLTLAVVERRQDQDVLAIVQNNQLANEQNEAQSYEEYMEFSTKLSSGLVKGAEYVGLGLVAASIKASELMYHGSEKLKENLEPETETPRIDPRLKTGLEVARWTASKAAQGSGYVVSKAGTATVALARFLAPHIRKQGVLALSHFVGQTENKSHKQMEIAGEIAGGTVLALSSIFMSLEHSSKILAQNMANNTVNVVSHKYGAEAGGLTENALSTAGNTYLTVYNAAALGPKGLAKRVVKNTGRVLINAEPEQLELRRESANKSLLDHSAEKKD